MSRFRAFLFSLADFVSGIGIADALKELRRTQYLEPAELTKLRENKLRRLARHAYETVPYYQKVMNERCLKPEMIRGVDDLKFFPVLTKEIVRAQRGAIRSKSFAQASLVRGQTGGSTGSPITYYCDPRTRASIRAHYYRGLEWMGWRAGDPIVSFWGRRLDPTLSNQMGEWIRRMVTHHREIDAHQLDDSHLETCLDVLRREPRSILIGYASALVALAKHLVRSGGRRPSLKGIFSTAEILSDKSRTLLEKTFNCRVFNAYGLSEVQSVGYQCDQGGIHISEERVHLEVAPDGRALVTDLENLAMPFLRYDTGDALILDERPCSCGRTLKLIQRIHGRICHVIEGLNGKRVHGEYFTHLLETSETFATYQIEQFQVVQNSPNRILVRLVAGLRPTEDQLEKLAKSIQDHLGPVSVQFDFPNQIPPSKLGKRDFVVPHEIRSSGTVM